MEKRRHEIAAEKPVLSGPLKKVQMQGGGRRRGTHRRWSRHTPGTPQRAPEHSNAADGLIQRPARAGAAGFPVPPVPPALRNPAPRSPRRFRQPFQDLGLSGRRSIRSEPAAPPVCRPGGSTPLPAVRHDLAAAAVGARLRPSWVHHGRHHAGLTRPGGGRCPWRHQRRSHHPHAEAAFAIRTAFSRRATRIFTFGRHARLQLQFRFATHHRVVVTTFWTTCGA